MKPLFYAIFILCALCSMLYIYTLYSIISTLLIQEETLRV